MREALKEAEKAYESDEVPIGAVIVSKNTIIARTHNQTELLKDFTAHAEMLALTAASEYLGNKYLDECTIYITLEPCTMCAGAMYWTQIKEIVYACRDEKRGFLAIAPQTIHPATIIRGGVLALEASKLIKKYFKEKR